MKTQRQWNDLAIARITPVLLALFSLVSDGLPVARTLGQAGALSHLVSQAACDLLGLLGPGAPHSLGLNNYSESTSEPEMVIISAKRLDRLFDELAATA
ncbi:hypothetical protein [Thiorhodococcus drewsii]|uniref:hypothetical protein n=1 Tax=Thiorhodococcus drewsii TaxID=210408 RepID=UPI0005944D21|nr:hypothetical protein [Thiorhodococcus drewsii]